MAVNVLIVDDSPAMRSFVRRVLDLSGLELGQCLEAANGEEALETLRRSPVDVILTDINMPGMDGEELLQQVARDEALHKIPVIVVSTDATILRMKRMLALGAKGYLRKPFFPEALREEIDRVCGGSQ